jgi:hypothetical protein
MAPHNLVMPPDGFVGVGHSGFTAAVWASDDGAEWERLPTDEDFGGCTGLAVTGAPTVSSTFSPIFIPPAADAVN